MSTAQKSPANHEAEQSVLGALLLDPARVVPVVGRIVGQADFLYPAHGTIYAAILQTWSALQAVDPMLLTDTLRRAGDLEKVGGEVNGNKVTGAAYITGLIDFTPTAANARYYAEAVREAAGRRRIWQVCAQVAGRALSAQSSSGELAAELSALLGGLAHAGAQYKTFAEHLDDAVERYEQAATRQGALPPGVVPTGLASLDRELDGGCFPADFIVLAAETSGGKTALAMDVVCAGSVDAGVGSMVASYEMRASQLVDRLVAKRSGVPANKLRGGKFTEADYHRLTKAMQYLRTARIHLRDRIGRWTVDDVAAEARALKAREGLGLVVVDYLQLMAPRPAARGRQVNREREVAEMSRELKALAVEMDVPVIALSQLTDGKLRESRAIGHDADVVITIEDAYEPDDRKHMGSALDDQRVIRINKNRSGQRDQTVRVNWDGPQMRFSDRASERTVSTVAGLH